MEDLGSVLAELERRDGPASCESYLVRRGEIHTILSASARTTCSVEWRCMARNVICCETAIRLRLGRVEMWRGGCRLNISVAASFV